MMVATTSHHLASRWINGVLVWDQVSQHTVLRNDCLVLGRRYRRMQYLAAPLVPIRG